ncbi:MAG: metallophosphoesterase [Pseudomonadota bacterium]
MTAFRLAHLSDVHLSLEGHVPFGALLSKRAVGFVSWNHRRRWVHRAEVLEALVDDLRQQEVDHIVVTGDLVNLALPQEFTAASLWLKQLGSPHDVTVIPGNHDAYVPKAWRRGWALWQPFMSGDESSLGDPVSFPYIRERGPITLIGLSTAVPTAPLLASGRIGAHQLGRLREVLQSCVARDSFRIVMMHHPPAINASARHKRLRDGAQMRRLLETMGSELVLSGHEHRFLFFSLAGPKRPIPAFCVPSASHSNSQTGKSGGYAIYTIERKSDGDAGSRWRLQVEQRGLDLATGKPCRQSILELVDTADQRSLMLSPIQPERSLEHA